MARPSDIHVVIKCAYGCCPGCQDCYGMSIGCHQDPCRCDLPCACRYADEDDDPRWRDGCKRHDDSTDRRWLDRFMDSEPVEMDGFGPANPCPVCGSPVECGVDTEGRPWVHVNPWPDGGE